MEKLVDKPPLKFPTLFDNTSVSESTNHEYFSQDKKIDKNCYKVGIKEGCMTSEEVQPPYDKDYRLVIDEIKK